MTFCPIQPVYSCDTVPSPLITAKIGGAFTLSWARTSPSSLTLRVSKLKYEACACYIDLTFWKLASISSSEAAPWTYTRRITPRSSSRGLVMKDGVASLGSSLSGA